MLISVPTDFNENKNQQILIFNEYLNFDKLLKAVNYFEKYYKYGILVIEKYSYALFNMDKSFYFFNSHSTNNIGLMTNTNGFASIIEFDKKEQVMITKFILSLHYLNLETQFSIQPLTTEILEKKQLKRDISDFSREDPLPDLKTLKYESKYENIQHFNVSQVVSDNVLDNMYQEMQCKINYSHLKTNIIMFNSKIIISLINSLRKTENTVYSKQPIDHSYDDLIVKLGIKEMLIPIVTQGDGNCFL